MAASEPGRGVADRDPGARGARLRRAATPLGARCFVFGVASHFFLCPLLWVVYSASISMVSTYGGRPRARRGSVSPIVVRGPDRVSESRPARLQGCCFAMCYNDFRQSGCRSVAAGRSSTGRAARAEVLVVRGCAAAL